MEQELIDDLSRAIYYGTRELDGFGIEAKDDVIEKGLRAMEQGVTFEDTLYAVPISIKGFIEAVKKRGWIDRLDKIMGYDSKNKGGQNE